MKHIPWVAPEFFCNDCGTNTVPIDGAREYYEVFDDLWHRAGAPGIGQSDNGPGGFFLCIGCLEARLGRELQPWDFKPYPANIASPWLSARLNSRLGGICYGTKETREQYHPNGLYEWADHVTPTGSITFPKAA